MKKNSNSKKGGKGIPRVTAKIVAMSDADRKQWVASLQVSTEVKKEIEERLAKALTTGPKARKINLNTLEAAMSTADIATNAKIKAFAEKYMKDGKETAIAELKKKIAADQEALKAIQTA